MQVELLEILGLVGVTLVITAGSVFDGLREWLLGFKHRFNFLRMFGELISCPMCAGAWVGVGWAWLDGQDTLTAIVTGGLISASSLVANMGLQLAGSFQHKQEGQDKIDGVRQLLLARAEQKAALKAAKQKTIEGVDLTEDEADSILDEQEGSADRTVE